MTWFTLLPAILGYLLGSFPTGYLVGRWRGIDIRDHGSGNIGATNVVRVLGKRPGYFVFFCDLLKGWLAVRAGMALGIFFEAHTGTVRFQTHHIFSTWDYFTRLTYVGTIAGILAALCCILGHNFPVWLRFRGGKGVATTVGVLLGLMPSAIGISALVWIGVFYLFRYVSLASLVGATTLPISVWTLNAWSRARVESLRNADPRPLYFWFSLAAAALIFWRHRANIQRLLDGTEARFGRKTPPAPPAP